VLSRLLGMSGEQIDTLRRQGVLSRSD